MVVGALSIAPKTGNCKIKKIIKIVQAPSQAQLQKTAPPPGSNMSSFFTVPKFQKKRKRVAVPETPKKRLAASKPGTSAASLGTKKGRVRKKARQKDEQDSISGSDSDDENQGDEKDFDQDGGSVSGQEGETAAETRLRLAERYLENLKQDVAEDYGFDAQEIDKDILATRLEDDMAESKGKVYKVLTPILGFGQASHTFFKTNTQTVTAVATQDNYAYLVTKDLMLTKWKLQELPKYQYPVTKKKRPKKPPPPPRKQPERVRIYRGDRHKAKSTTYKGHTKSILAVAVSSDGKYVVTGGADHKIIVYETETLKPVRVFTHHRSGVTGLVFRRGTNEMYSCGRDKVVRVWSLNELAYVSSLFGHEEAVVDIDALAHEKCISVGSRDRTARLWKIIDEKQLVFRWGARDMKPTPGIDVRSQAQEGSIDRVAMIDDELFVTGGDSGAITLWSIQKKNPIYVLPRAHGVEEPAKLDAISAEANPDPDRASPAPQPRWITALKTVPYSDVILSGSWDGYVRAWCLVGDKTRIHPIGVLGGAPHHAATPHPPSSPAQNNVTHEITVTAVNDLEMESSFQDLSEKEKEGKEANNIPSQVKQQTLESSVLAPRPQKPHSSTDFLIKGVINDLSVFERGTKGKDGLCVVAAVGQEHKFGRWMKRIPGSKNGGVIFEIPRISQEERGGSLLVNGTKKSQRK